MLHDAKVLPRNLKHDFYTGGVVNWRTRIVHWAAVIAGLCVKVEGMPLGSPRNLERHTGECCAKSIPVR